MGTGRPRAGQREAQLPAPDRGPSSGRSSASATHPRHPLIAHRALRIVSDSVTAWIAGSSGSRTSTGSPAPCSGQRRLSPDEVARYLFRRVVSVGAFEQRVPRERRPPLSRRRQPPRVRHPRVRLALLDVVAHDKAGERILESLVHSAEQRLDEEGIRGEIYLFKNNTDSAGNSYGCHENYLVSRHKDFHRTVDVLMPFLVTRQIFLGAGKLAQTPRGTAFRCRSGPSTSGKGCRRPPPAPGRSSTPGTSPTPTPSASAGST
jgi:hypothetical protein